MDVLTIAEAAQTTGWSPRMLRYIEEVGLIEATRSGAGYRLYGPGQLQRLRTLRELLSRHGVALGEVGFAARLHRDPGLREAIERWLEAEPRRPAEVDRAQWLRWEQDKHERLLAPVPLRPDAARPDARADPAPPDTAPPAADLEETA